MKPRLIAWGVRQVLRHGFPRRVVSTYVGVGDELMTAAALRELHVRGQARGVWMLTRYPELHRRTALDVTFVPWDARYGPLADRLGRPRVSLGYSDYDEAQDRDRPLPGHAIATFCRQLGVAGPVALKPHLDLTEAERASGRRQPRQIVVQSSGGGALIPMLTKMWPAERMQQVVDALTQDGYVCIQLGSPVEPALHGTLDLRGKTTLREAAAILSQARLFVGMVGGLMHLARAVDCRAVIVYGGREEPSLAGYAAYANLTERPPCSPCYFRQHCPHDMICMQEIAAARVIAAAREQLQLAGQPLEVETAAV